MSYNLRNSLSTLFLISFILIINLIVALAANRETIKRNTDDQDDEWIIKQKPGSDLMYNSGLDDNSLERILAILNPRNRGRLSSLLSSSSSVSSPSSLSSLGPFNYVNPEKRQIRYHQCYFNPISCFRRRK